MVDIQGKKPNCGRVKRTVLFHALEEGVVTVATLQKLTGLSIFRVRYSLERLCESGLMHWVSREVTPSTDRRFSGHGLTAKGIEAALLVDPADVLFSAEKMECH